jgi:hypothetical protein
MENIEHRLISKLKQEIKAELKEELRDELKEQLRKEVSLDLGIDYITEIRKIIKTELRSIIFDEKYYETAITTYIKSLAYKEYQFLIMLNRGLVKNGPTTIEVSEFASGNFSMNKVKNQNLIAKYNHYLKGNYINCSYDQFCVFLNFEDVEDKIIWRHKARHGFTYRGLFALYESVFTNDFTDLHINNQLMIIGYISNKFIFEGTTKTLEMVEDAFKTYIKLPEEKRLVK